MPSFRNYLSDLLNIKTQTHLIESSTKMLFAILHKIALLIFVNKILYVIIQLE